MDRIDELKIKVFDIGREMNKLQKKQKTLIDELIKIEKEAEKK